MNAETQTRPTTTMTSHRNCSSCFGITPMNRIGWLTHLARTRLRWLRGRDPRRYGCDCALVWPDAWWVIRTVVLRRGYCMDGMAHMDYFLKRGREEES